MLSRQHQFLNVNGIRLHTVVEGEGPLVLLLHGWPESWYAWRHQLSALASAGYRAVAFDQRGYGRSSKFWKPDAYRIDKLVDDVCAVVQHFGKDQAVVVGHDWGAAVAWTAAWMRPEFFRGVIGSSVPFADRALCPLPGSPFGEIRPKLMYSRLAGPGQTFYQDYFGQMDAVVTEFESDVRRWILGATWSFSGDVLSKLGVNLDNVDPVDFLRGTPLCIPNGSRMRDRFVPSPDVLPDWFSDADLEFIVSEFEHSGFSGAVAYYHNFDPDWDVLGPQSGNPVTVPALYIGGEFDVVRTWGREALDQASTRIPNYLGSRIIAGSGHWIPQERPAEFSRLLLEFLRAL